MNSLESRPVSQSDVVERSTSDFWTTLHSYDDYRVLYSSCKQELDSAERERIVADLQAGLPEYGIRQYWDRQPAIFRDYDACAILRTREGRTVGLVGGKWFQAVGRRVFYLWTAQLAEDYQGTAAWGHLYNHYFLRVLEDQGCPDVVTMKTFSPKVYALWRRYTDLIDGVSFYPDLRSDVQSPALAELATRIASELWPALAFDARYGIVRGGQDSVAPDFFPEMPHTDDTGTRIVFEREVTRSDQVLCISVIPDSAKPGHFELYRKLRDAAIKTA